MEKRQKSKTRENDMQYSSIDLGSQQLTLDTKFGLNDTSWKHFVEKRKSSKTRENDMQYSSLDLGSIRLRQGNKSHV